MMRRPPSCTRTDTPLPDTTLFRSAGRHRRADRGQRSQAAGLCRGVPCSGKAAPAPADAIGCAAATGGARSEEHTSELQSLMRISYAVFCLKTKLHRIHVLKDHLNKHIHLLLITPTPLTP